MSDIRQSAHEATVVLVEKLPPLDALMSRGDRRRLVREACEWYLDAHARGATRNGTCVVVTAGPPGAGKTSTLRDAVDDLQTRLVIDPDLAKEFLARWCLSSGSYEEALSARLPDGRNLMPLDLSPALQTMSTEVCNAVRRVAVERAMDIVLEGTMSTPAYGERLLLSLGKGDYEELLIVSVEVDRASAQERARARWWSGRLDDHELGGRLVLPSAIDAMYPEEGGISASRIQARHLLATIRSGGTALAAATLMEYDDGMLTTVDAKPPRALSCEARPDRWAPLAMVHEEALEGPR